MMKLGLASRLAVALCLGVFFAAGCSRSQDPFPVDIKIDRARQADLVAEFIHDRFDVMDEFAEGFADYARQVERGEGVSPKAFSHNNNFWVGYWGPLTEEVIDEFLDSPEGAYLSELDREFIWRTFDLRQRTVDSVFAQLDEEGLGPSTAFAQGFRLMEWYTGAYQVREALRQIPDALLEDCARNIRDLMLTNDRIDLWQATVSGDADAVRPYRDSSKDSTLVRLTTPGVYAALDKLRPNTVDEAAVAPMVALITLAITQVFSAQVYGHTIHAVERVGFNAFMGERELERLHQRGIAAIRAVEAGQ